MESTGSAANRFNSLFRTPQAFKHCLMYLRTLARAFERRLTCFQAEKEAQKIVQKCKFLQIIPEYQVLMRQ